MNFDKIIGNDEIKKLLNKQLETKRIVHSYLFVGIEGIGKKIFAREFAQKILCLNDKDKDNCESCIKFLSRKSSGF